VKGIAQEEPRMSTAEFAAETFGRPYVPDLPFMSERDFYRAVAAATPGSSVTYHVGMLAVDRDLLATSLSSEQRRTVHEIAHRAAQLAATGWGFLVQRRLGTARFAYELVIARRPLSKRSARAMLTPPELLAEAA